MSLEPNKYDNDLEREAASLLYYNSYAGLALGLVVAAIIAFGFDNPALANLKQTWWVAILLMSLLRIADTLYWRFKLVGTEFNGNKAKVRFTIGALSIASLWSLYAVLAFPHLGYLELACTISVICGMTGGAAALFSPSRFIAIAYSCIMLVPVSAHGLLATNEYQQLLGMLGFILAIALTLSANKTAIFTRSALRTKHQNDELLLQMKAEQETALTANDSLEDMVKKRTQQIYELSNIDPLTNLFNRKAFGEQLFSLIDVAQQKQEDLALLFVDLDGFKEINDTIGHTIGDAVLKEAARRIEDVCGNHYNMCRWGGDEFLVALPNCNKSSALQKAQEFIEAVSRPIIQDNQQLSVGATIGIAMYPEHVDKAEGLIQLADTAMYHQKSKMKSTACIFDQDMMSKIKREQELRDGLMSAVERNQLRLFYQPIVDAKTKKVAAFEALLRWEYNGSFVAPDEFISVAEQYGSIIKIGTWVLYTACQEAAKWNFSEQKPSVCVNVSIIQLMDDSFIDKVQDALEQASLHASRLHIEVTESLFAENKDKLKRQLMLLQDMGVQVSIDDFGTGYSSLSQLQNLAVNIVKIDRSFVQNIEQGGKAIIHATMHIMRELNCKVVAEGTENEKQVALLQDMGIDFLQGYHFAKPLPSHEVTKWQRGYNQSLITHTASA